MAIEQNEIKKVITVDLGNTATSLKEYKKHIDDLKGSLLQLDETSEEYQKIAEEVKNEQDKLNEVMKVGKTTTDAAEGSYDKLAKTMAELKKQWKATGDEAERTELGKQILDINNQLKELDASTGNYQRNVGDYANAFEQAFDKCLDGIQSLDGPLGEIGGMTKQLLPVIKSINATAISGLSGIKKAIASTGIGLLVVAVGMLAAHWEDVKKAVNGLNPITQKYNMLLDETKRKVESIKREWEITNMAQQVHLEVMQAQGKSTIEQLEYIRDNAKKRLEDLDKANAKLAQGMEEAEKMIENGAKAEDLFGGQYTQRLTEYNEYGKQRLQLTKEISDAEWKISLENIKLNTEQKKKEEAEAKAEEEKRKSLAAERKKQYEQEKKEAQTLYDTVRKNSLSELELLEENYKEQKAKLEKFGFDTTELTKQFEKDKKEIIAKGEAEIQAIEDERYQNIKDRYDSEAEQLLFEAEIEIENEQKLADAKYQIEQDLLEKKIALQEQYIEEYNGDQEGLILAEEELDSLRQQFANNKIKYEKETSDYVKKTAEEEKKAKIATLNATLGLTSTVLGTISEMYEEGSEEQKNLQIAETTINTLSGAIGAFMQAMSNYPAPYGAIIGAISAASATAAGIAQIAKIKSVNKDSASASIASPQISAPSMTTVNPLLDETQDINRFNMSGMQGNSQEQSNMRVYVVDQDIRDANQKAEVVENNATF